MGVLDQAHEIAERIGDGRHANVATDVPVPAPVSTVVTRPTAGSVERVDVLGGLIHEYRAAA